MGQSTPSPHSAKAFADGSELTFRADGTPLARTMNGDQLFAEQAADGKLVQVEDGVEQRLPPNPDAEFGGVSGRDALRARQQVRMAVRVHARSVSAAGGPAVVRRMPASRAAARRPRPAAKRTSTRAGPSSDDDPGEPEPPPRRPDAPDALSGPSPRFSRPWRGADDALAQALHDLRGAP